MKEYLTHFIRFAIALSLALTLQACGGSSNSNNNSSANYSISADTTSITFSNEFLQVSDDTFLVNVTFSGNGLLLGYAPGSQAVGWLNFSTKTVTGNSAVIEVKVVNAENIIADQYQTKIRLSTGDVNEVNLVHHDIDVSLLVWQLTTDRDLISFAGTLGDTSVADQTLSITSDSNNTWTAAVDADWLNIDTNQGTGSGEIKLNADLSTLTFARKYEATLTLTETTTGDTKLIPVELGLDRHYLFADIANVGFTSTGNIENTSRTVTIASNSPAQVKWQLSSDVNWITTERSLTDINELTIKKDPNTALENGIHYATLTIQAVDDQSNIDENVVPEIIKVAFYQDDESTSTVTKAGKNIALDSLVTSPYLPYFYTAEQNAVVVYNLYTGAQIDTIAVANEGIPVDQLIMHPDGELLLVRGIETITNEDQTTTQTVHRYQVNLTDKSVTKIEGTDLEFQPVKYVTVAGRHFVVSQTLEFANSDLKRVYWDRENAFFTTLIEQANQAKTLYALDPLTNTFKRYTASVNDFTQSPIALTQTHEYKPELLQENQAVSAFIVDPQDKGLYLISPTSEWIAFDGSTFTDNGLLEQNENATTLALTQASNGVAHYARFTQTEGFYIDVYDNAQKHVNSITTQGQQPAFVTMSADDRRLLINAALAQQIEVVSVEQIAVSASTLSFNSSLSEPIALSQSFTVSNISENWQVTTDTQWLNLTTTFDQGTGTINVNIDHTKLTASGTYKAKVTIYDPNSGLSRVVFVEVNIDEIRLFASAPAIGFNALNNKENLSATLSILDNSTVWDGNWTATSDVSWLTLSTNTNADILDISADPSALSDGIHEAVITLEGNDPSSPITAGKIKVSLTKQNLDSGEIVLNDININNNQIVFNPFKPYLYFADGDKILVVNVNDGNVENTIASPLQGAELGNLVIHPDGSMLMFSNTENFVDENGQNQTRNNYYKLALDTHDITAISSELVTIDQRYQPALIAMISGKAVVITESQEIADLNLTSLHMDVATAFLAAQFYDVKNNDNVLSFNALTNELVQRELDYNSVASNPITLVGMINYQNDAFNNSVRGIAANKNGSNLYTASLASEWSTFDGTAFSDQGVLHASPILATLKTVTDNADNLFVYRFNGVTGYNLAKYDANQQLIWEVIHTTGAVDSFISPAYHRLISYNGDANTLSFDTLPN